MMTKSKSRKEAVIKYLFALPVILLLVIIFSKKEAIANTDNELVEIVNVDNYENLNAVDGIEKYLESEVDEMPLFPGCEDITDKEEQRKCSNKKMLTFIYTNIKYPKAAREADIQGKVIIKFLVKKDGTITNARIADDIGGGCGEEALRVMKTLPKMIPGQKNGKAVDTEMLIPVSFKLMDDDEPTSDSKASLEDLLKKDNVKFKIGGKDALIFGTLNPEEKNIYTLDGKTITEAEANALSPDDIATIDIRKVKKATGDKEHLHNLIMIVSKENLPSSSEPVYNQVDEMPRFAGCEEKTNADERKFCSEKKLMEFIYTNIKYPAAAREANIQGKVVLQFVVQKDGSIGTSKILRDIGGGCGAAAEKVIQSMPNWIPGKQEGENVNVKFTMPIVFKLAGDSKKAEAKDSDPLIVVDGEIQKRGTLDEINPSDIKTMSVLKGEKAIEKYGDAGKNGVIEIQLKKQKTSTESSSATTRTHPIEKRNALKEAGLTYVKISPNPTNGRINIEYGSQEKPLTIRILDINGKEIYQKNLVGGKGNISNLDVSNAAKGMLFVSFTQDEKTYTEKVILQ